MSNDSTFASLNHARENTETRWKTGVGVVNEYFVGRTFTPTETYRCIDCSLNIRSVEINICSSGSVVERAREAEDIPEFRTSRSDLINIPAWINIEYFIVDEMKDIAFSCGSNSVISSARKNRWQGSWWWENEILVKEIGIAASVGNVVYGSNK